MALASKNLRVLNENLENAASLGQSLGPMTYIWKDFMRQHAWKQNRENNATLDQQHGQEYAHFE